MIVDSSIVLVENAYRNIANALAKKGHLTGDEYRDISILSAKQVGRAIFFSELVILVGFLPVFLLTGQEGKLFHPLAYTKTFVMISSALVVITLIPVLMAHVDERKFPSGIRQSHYPILYSIISTRHSLGFKTSKSDHFHERCCIACYNSHDHAHRI